MGVDSKGIKRELGEILETINGYKFIRDKNKRVDDTEAREKMIK